MYILSINDFYYNRKKSKWKNDGIRSLYESVIPNEVLTALDDWKLHNNSNCVLIGGLALSYYTKPRYTEDIDLIFLTEEDIPEKVYKFRRNRQHSFEHIKTGVEVEVLTPKHINKGIELFKNVIDSSVKSDGIKIASPLGLIALKLFRSKTNDRDRLDIIELCKYCYENNIKLDISNFDLTDDEIKTFNEIKNNIDFEKISENMYLLEIKSYFKNNINYKKIDLDKYEIYIFNEKFGEPRFHFGKNFKKIIKGYSDCHFSISLTKPFDDNNNLRVLESSTEYKSFNGFKDDEYFLKNWLNENLIQIKKIWSEINKKNLK